MRGDLDDYLRSPQWRRTRAAALLRAGRRCAIDARHTEGIEVFHVTYDRLGAELPDDLVVLCPRCLERYLPHAHARDAICESVPPPGMAS